MLPAHSTAQPRARRLPQGPARELQQQPTYVIDQRISQNVVVRGQLRKRQRLLLGRLGRRHGAFGAGGPELGCSIEPSGLPSGSRLRRLLRRKACPGKAARPLEVRVKQDARLMGLSRARAMPVTQKDEIKDEEKKERKRKGKKRKKERGEIKMNLMTSSRKNSWWWSEGAGWGLGKEEEENRASESCGVGRSLAEQGSRRRLKVTDGLSSWAHAAGVTRLK